MWTGVWDEPVIRIFPAKSPGRCESQHRAPRKTPELEIFQAWCL
jgi:hypothetical protein